MGPCGGGDPVISLPLRQGYRSLAHARLVPGEACPRLFVIGHVGLRSGAGCGPSSRFVDVFVRCAFVVVSFVQIVG